MTVYLPDPHTQHQAVSAWFLGPKAENFDILRKAFEAILTAQREVRLNYFPEDKASITHEITGSTSFESSVAAMEAKFESLLAQLANYSIPFFSPRYSAHMAMENCVPAILGYLSAMLGYNPNNVAFETSPVTTLLEIEVGLTICDMLGYTTSSTDHSASVAWGHVTCDGTVANLESLWAARNLKFYPLSFRDAMATGGPLEFLADSFMVVTCKGEEKYMRDLDTWELLNLRVETILEIPDRLHREYQISQGFLDDSLSPYIIQTVGKDALETKWNIKTPQLFYAKTKHYSWPKSAAITGIGSGNGIDVDVDIDACMDMDRLEALLRERYANQRAVYAVVAIIGTTEEGAVDPLDKIETLRATLQTELGLSFVIHADAAWGGYFKSMIPRAISSRHRSYVPGIALCPHTILQLTSLSVADSITIDPHKSGYVPYPAGTLCYRDRRMRNLLTWTASYLNQGEVESIGIYGVEGSKPGAAPTAVWLAHEVIPLDPTGLGALLGEVSFTCRRFSAHWAAMSGDDTDFIVVPLNPLPVERGPDCTPEMIEQQKQEIRDTILGIANEDLSADAMTLLAQLGSNLNINAFACNFKINGEPNTDVNEANYLNRRIFERLSITAPGEDPNSIPFYLTSTTFKQEDYGVCATHFKERLGLVGDQDLFVLRNVVMSPFTTSSNFVAELAATFKQVLKEEMQVVLQRDSSAPDVHEFLVQGKGKTKYLVYQPVFKKLNSCYQIILSADVEFTSPNSNTTIFLQNKEKATLQDLCSKDFTATVTFGTASSKTRDVQATNVHVVKQGSLNFNDRTLKYPDTFMPFYLYGTSGEYHLTHLISLDPNIQLCAAGVSLTLDPPLSAADLTQGVIVFAHGIHEASMEPFPSNAKLPPRSQFFFRAGKTLNVTVFKDATPASFTRTVQVPQQRHRQLAAGTVTLGTQVYVDNDRLNEDPWDLSHTLDGVMKEKTKRAWVDVVKKARMKK